jgi:hypothetical protein
MFTFIKQLFGFDKPTMKEAGVQLEQAPYKVPEPAATTPIPLAVEVAPIAESLAAPVVVEKPTVVETPAEPVKKARKPRAPKSVAEKPAAKKAALVKKAAAIKATTKARTSRSKKA